MKKIFQLCITIITFNLSANALSYSNPSTINWMSQIPNNRILNQLIIPGTHDSGTSNITENSYFSYNQETPLPIWLQVIANIVPHSVLRSVAADWSRTQPYSIQQQLDSGIRYFDFQVCSNAVPRSDTDFSLCNNLIGDKLSDALNQIVNFVMENPSEFVIINISHVYGINNTFEQIDLISLLNAVLFNVAAPNTLAPNTTIGELRKTNRHIILFMDPPQYSLQKPDLKEFTNLYVWDRSNLDAPIPNASTLVNLKQILDTEVALRKNTFNTSHQFFALQAIQSPSELDVINGILDKKQNPDSIETYEKPVNDNLPNWLADYITKYQASSLNIITQDWFTDDSALVSLAMKYDSLPGNTSINTAERKTMLEQKLRQLKALYSGVMPG